MNTNKKLIVKLIDGIAKETDIAVIGLSGGADSTLVAILCKIALGKENVYGIHLPCGSIDIEEYNKRSIYLGKYLEINNHVLDITADVDAIINTSIIVSGSISKLNIGNIKSRARTLYLYTINQQIAEQTGKRCRVIGTGNLSENFIGYDTKGGDALADLFPIGKLYKSEVYALLDYFVSEDVINDTHIDRVPSAGLWEGQTDEKELGYSYDEMEPAIRFILLGNYFGNSTERLNTAYIKQKIDKFLLPNKDIVDFVWERYLNNKHKHEPVKVLNID